MPKGRVPVTTATVLPLRLPISVVQSRGLAGKADAQSSPSEITSFSWNDGIRMLRVLSKARFDETVEIAMRLSIDARKPQQNVKGLAKLPNGTGKAVRIAVFAKGEKAAEANAAGADIVGDIDLANAVQDGRIDFTTCIATPDMMPVVGRVARILGPRGLMPNPKLGTVTADVAAAVKASKQGQVQFKNDKSGYIHIPIGKLSFSDEQLSENMSELVRQVNESRPTGLKSSAAGFIARCTLSSSMGPGIPLDLRLPPFKAAKLDMRGELKEQEATVPQVQPISWTVVGAKPRLGKKSAQAAAAAASP